MISISLCKTQSFSKRVSSVWDTEQVTVKLRGLRTKGYRTDKTIIKYSSVNILSKVIFSLNV